MVCKPWVEVPVELHVMHSNEDLTVDTTHGVIHPAIPHMGGGGRRREARRKGALLGLEKCSFIVKMCQ